MKRCLLLPFALALLPAGCLLGQGTLTPPGAPAATMKTLDQLDAKLEPRLAINPTNTPGNATANFVISSSGSYYLTGNLTGVSGKAGILIQADDVDLDLCGFTLTGVTGASVGVNFSNRSRVAIRHGIVRSWPSGGLSGTGATAARLTGLTMELNGNHGVIVGDTALVADCISRGNTGTGAGFVVGIRCQIWRCLANSNGAAGIAVGGETQVVDCVASANGAVGISFSGSAGRASGCTVTSNATGINHGSGSAIVERCIARSNTGTGISVGTDAVVTQCTASENADGIVCSGQALISGNVCSGNNNAGAGAGIRVSGSRSRVEGNMCNINDLGIVTSGSPNLVIRNHCQQNTTNYSLFGVGAGPLVTTANIATSTNPHANFDF